MLKAKPDIQLQFSSWSRKKIFFFLQKRFFQSLLSYLLLWSWRKTTSLKLKLYLVLPFPISMFPDFHLWSRFARLCSTSIIVSSAFFSKVQVVRDFNLVVDNMTIEAKGELGWEWLLTQIINHISDREKITIEKLNELQDCYWVCYLVYFTKTTISKIVNNMETFWPMSKFLSSKIIWNHIVPKNHLMSQNLDFWHEKNKLFRVTYFLQIRVCWILQISKIFNIV